MGALYRASFIFRFLWWTRRESNSCPKYIQFHNYLRDSHMIDNFKLFVWSCDEPYTADRLTKLPQVFVMGVHRLLTVPALFCAVHI